MVLSPHDVICSIFGVISPAGGMCSYSWVGCVLIHGWDYFLPTDGITSYPRMGSLPTHRWDHFLPVGGITFYLQVGSLPTHRSVLFPLTLHRYSHTSAS